MGARRMTRLGRRGGVKGGPARARALPPKRRQEIAREAARSRWEQPVLVFDRAPRDLKELSALVGHYGTRVARGKLECDLDGVLLRALKASRRDPALARMLPVFIWRMREELDLQTLASRAKRLRRASELGYFLELAGTLGRAPKLSSSAQKLRTTAPPRPRLFFESATRNPFEAMVAGERTPEEARRWGLLTGMPTDSFASYFEKVRDL